MSELCAGLGAGRTHPQVRDLLEPGRGVLRGAGPRPARLDVFTKRVASRLLAQFAHPGSAATPTSPTGWPRTCCSSARRPRPARRASRAAPDARCARPTAWPTQHAVDYTPSVLGRFDPALHRPGAQARRRAPRRRGRRWPAARCTASPAWPSSSRWSAIRCSGCIPPARRSPPSCRRGRRRPLQRRPRRRAPLAMEVATSVLYLEAALEDGDSTIPSTRERVQRLGRAHRRGAPEAAARAARAWMEELYRRVSDRQTMGSVVQELRASLSEVEKSIDQFFRNPAERDGADPGAGAAVVDARRALGARHGPGVAGRAAHARRGRRAWSRPRSIREQRRRSRRVRPPGRQPGRAGLPDRHAQRAAAAWRSRCSSSTPKPAS